VRLRRLFNKKVPDARRMLLRAMLAFDIETTGLEPASSVVTVVCTQDSVDTQIQTVLVTNILFQNTATWTYVSKI
jgi:uncharacterized protein YprB with RNaseH-like and TPR domain